MAAVLRTQCVRRAACEFARIDRELDADPAAWAFALLARRFSPLTPQSSKPESDMLSGFLLIRAEGFLNLRTRRVRLEFRVAKL